MKPTMCEENFQNGNGWTNFHLKTCSSLEFQKFNLAQTSSADVRECFQVAAKETRDEMAENRAETPVLLGASN